jgi:hypothetical protein
MINLVNYNGAVPAENSAGSSDRFYLWLCFPEIVFY